MCLRDIYVCLNGVILLDPASVYTQSQSVYCLLLFCSIDTQYACIIYEGTEQFTCSLISPNAKFTLLMMKDLSDFLFDEELSYNLISLNVLKIYSFYTLVLSWISVERCEGSKMKLER